MIRMYRKIVLLLIYVFAFSFFASSNNVGLGEEKNVLIVYTYSPTNTAYKIIQSGIVEKLDNEFGEDYNLHLEYLETDRFADIELIKKRIDHLNEKCPAIKPDLLVCVGIGGIGLLKMYGDSCILKLPTLNYDFDLTRYGIKLETHLNSKTFYMGLDLDIALTIESALKIFPKTDTVYFINGSASNDTAYRKLTELVIQNKFPQLHLIPLYDYPMADLLLKVNYIAESSLVFFASYNGDGNGLPFYNNDAIELIRTACKAPIFGYTDLGFNIGMFGGEILSFKKSGLFAGDAAIKILKGADPAAMRIKKEDYYSYQFDWRELQRFNIGEENIVEKEYIIFNRDHSFIEEHKYLILGIFLFVLLQTILIIRLVFLSRKKELMITQIRETEYKLREFANEDRILQIGQLSASLSHELIQPLTAILSTAQAGIRFIESKDCDPEFLKELFKNIIEDDKRTTSILRSIMGMMKLEDRKKERTEINTLIKEVVAIYKSEAIIYNIKIVVNFCQKEVFANLDKVQIQQVLLNLMLNATQAMVDTRDDRKIISISLVCELNGVKIIICDNGTGIDPCIMQNLFKPFLSTKEKGLGIGLSICKNIIEDHGGLIQAENLPDSGAKFTISLNTNE